MFLLALMLSATSAQAREIMSVKQLALGQQHACALLSNNRVKCWGYNTSGQLGLGDALSRGLTPEDLGDALPYVDLGTDKPVKAIAANLTLSCALFDDGSAKCWGDHHVRWGFDPPFPVHDVGKKLEELGANLPFFNFGAGEAFSDIQITSTSLCALSTSGKLKCKDLYTTGTFADVNAFDFGADTSVKNFAVGDAPNDQICFATTDARGACFGGTDDLRGPHGQFVPALNPVSAWPAPAPAQYQVIGLNFGAGIGVTKIATSYYSRCALLTSGEVKCWGNNYEGNLGTGDKVKRVGIEDFEHGLTAIDFGTDQPVTDIALAIYGASCALFADGKIKCWGENISGQLGLGDTNEHGTLPEQMGANLPYVDLGGIPASKLYAGNNSICAILANGGAKCWGLNAFGQLGVGDGVARGAQPSDMGSSLPFIRLWD